MAKSVYPLKYNLLAKELILQILGISIDGESFRKRLNYVLSNLLHHHCLDVNSHSVQKSLHGLAFKMDIHGHQNKSLKLLSLTQNFLVSECEQDADVKWSILSVLVDLAEQPARDSLSTSLREVVPVDASIDKRNLDTDWIRELMGKSFQPPDKDETLSEWSDDEEGKSSIQGNEFDEMMKLSSQSNKCEGTEYTEKVKLSLKNAQLAKTWIENTVQPNYWGPNDYSFASKSSGQNVSKMPIMSEYIVMRECLWILLCPTNGFLFYIDINGKHQVKAVSLSTVSSGSILNLLQKFASAADMLSIIDLWLENNYGLSNSFGSGTFQAYSDALRNWRHFFNKEIVELENIVTAQDGCETLIWLFDKLEPLLHNLFFIFEIHSESILHSSEKDDDKKSLQLINTLIKNIDCHSSIQSRECLLTILRFTLRHYFQQLQFLLYSRDIMSVSIKQPEINSLKEENSTANIYSCDESIIQHFRGLSFAHSIHQPLIKICKLKKIMGKLHLTVTQDCINIERHVDNKILEAFSPQDNKINCILKIEKTTNSKILKKDPSFLKQPITVSYPDEYLKMAFDSDEEESCLELSEERKFISTDISGFAKIEDILANSLIPIVEKRYQELSIDLMKFLKEKHNLQMQLSAFKSVALMEVGDSMREFYSYLFCKVDDRESVDGALLTQHIQYCVGFSYPLFAENFSIFISGMDIIKKNELSDKYFNSILSSMSIHYESLWPISMVLSDDIIKKYSKLFTFCLLLKRAIFSLERLHFKDIASYAACYSNEKFLKGFSFKEECSSFSSTQEIVEDQLPLMQRLHRLQLLRHWLIYLAGNLHDHFYISILMPLSQKVDKLILEEKYFEKFLSSHLRILNDACHQCLLKDDSLSPVQTALGMVFSTIESVRVLWKGSPDNITIPALVQLEEDYGTCHRFMANFFTSLSHSHACPHVEALAESLMNSSPA